MRAYCLLPSADWKLERQLPNRLSWSTYPLLAASWPFTNVIAGGPPGNENALCLIFALKFIAIHPLELIVETDPVEPEFDFIPITFRL